MLIAIITKRQGKNDGSISYICLGSEHPCMTALDQEQLVLAITTTNQCACALPNQIKILHAWLPWIKSNWFWSLLPPVCLCTANSDQDLLCMAALDQEPLCMAASKESLTLLPQIAALIHCQLWVKNVCALIHQIRISVHYHLRSRPSEYCCRHAWIRTSVNCHIKSECPSTAILNQNICALQHQIKASVVILLKLPFFYFPIIICL